MRTTVARSLTRRAFTRRELLAGSGVVLALLGLAAVENRKASAPVCGPGCATCINPVSLMAEGYAPGASNPPGALAPGPASISTNQVHGVNR